MSLFPNSFDRCQLKTIQTENLAEDDLGQIIPPNSPSNGVRYYAGSRAILHCPRTESEQVEVKSQYSNHSSPSRAIKSLSKIASAQVCGGCPYSGLSLEQFYDAQRAEQEARNRLAMARSIGKQIENGQPPELPDYRADAADSQ